MPRKKQSDSATSMLQDSSEEQDLFEKSNEKELEAKRNAPVTCLGKKFPNDDARRKHFLDELAKKLKDPKFRKIEGFPVGEDEDILALSDPPYYTACPNPWLGDLVAEWEKTKPGRARKDYSREPFAVDVSEGKTDPLYRAHSYHTKVPHLAIVPSILHYTEPGDIVLDGFCGSGMTGVAAQWCGAAPDVYRKELEAAWKREGRSAPKWGARRVVLNDLSPAASFIAANYNLPFDVKRFARAGRKLLGDLEKEIGWMYETLHTDGKTKGRIEYTVWSEVFTCPECSHDIVFLDEALDTETMGVRDTFPCPKCSATMSKRAMERSFKTTADPGIPGSWRRVRLDPVRIVYQVQGSTYEKTPDKFDLKLLKRIEEDALPLEVPRNRFPVEDMAHGSRIEPKGFTHAHHFFLPRAAHSLARLWRAAQTEPDDRTRRMLLFMVEQATWTASVLNRFRPTGYSQVNQYLTGVYYIPSQHAECSPWYILGGKLKRLASSFATQFAQNGLAAINTGTAAELRAGDGVIDYIFTDPPFGENIYYADLNYLVESWHRVTTDARPEAIVDRAKKKGLPDYQLLMQQCFAEYHRVLKPGRWMTVVFHNSRNSVWTAIQEGMLAAGFVVADVRTMDKQQGSYRQVTSTAMKQDLVISAYKPTDELERRFQLEAGTDAGMWQFVEEHLRQLPTFVLSKEGVETVSERTGYMLFDRMVAFHVQRGATVPMSAAEFFRALESRYPCRDEMYFLSAQASEYDKERAKHTGVIQFELFVSDEASAIAWLHQQLFRKPQTTQELTPLFINELRAWQKHEKPLELRELLEHNFICYAGSGEVPSQIHAYLSTNWKELRSKAKNDPELVDKAKGRWFVPDPKKAEDLEKVRERALLREFWEYLPEGYKPRVKTDMQAELPGIADVSKVPAGRRIKVIRSEAVRVGFKYCWQNQDYRTIVAVAKRIPEDVLQEDPKLLMWYDQAITRLGEE